MCGISGVFGSQLTEQNKNIVRAIVSDQYRRGPDHQDTEMIQARQSQLFLGHNRLSIVDLSDQANQPMYDITKRYCIVFNGEIYNYIELRHELIELGLDFATSSDTEVILNAFSCWGIDALKRFLGPFSFALFDKETDQLWLCRDRFGVRPLFYIQIGNTLYFASSTSVIAKSLSLKPNLTYLAKGLKYLTYEDSSAHSPYEKLHSLNPSHYMHLTYDTDGTLSSTLHRYYDLETNVLNLVDRLPVKNLNSLFGLLKETLDSSVKLRLRTDVPIAVSLSSGLDSTTVAALMCEQHKDVIGFSFGHPNNDKSEGPTVEKCSNFLNIPITYISPSPQQMIGGLFDTIQAQDAPFSSLSVVAQYLTFKQVHASGIKVLFGGQGGDEGFMGYKKFFLFMLKKLYYEKNYFSLTKSMMSLLPMLVAEWKALRSYWQHKNRYFDSKHAVNTLLLPEPSILPLNPSMSEPLWKRQMMDVTDFSLPTLLRYEDRNGMANSVESRLPFLDHRLIELGLALPVSMKLRAGFGKWPIRHIMRDRIPNQIRMARYKRGFDISMDHLLKAGLGEAIRNKLYESKHITSEFLSHGTSVEHVFSDQQFLKRQKAMSEAITMLWLNKVML